MAKYPRQFNSTVGGLNLYGLWNSPPTKLQKLFSIYNLVFKLFIVIIFVATISLNISVFCRYYEISLCNFFYFYLLYLYSKNRMVLNPHSVLMARNGMQNKPIIPRTIRTSYFSSLGICSPDNYPMQHNTSR